MLRLSAPRAVYPRVAFKMLPIASLSRSDQGPAVEGIADHADPAQRPVDLQSPTSHRRAGAVEHKAMRLRGRWSRRRRRPLRASAGSASRRKDAENLGRGDERGWCDLDYQPHPVVEFAPGRFCAPAATHEAPSSRFCGRQRLLTADRWTRPKVGSVAQGDDAHGRARWSGGRRI